MSSDENDHCKTSIEHIFVLYYKTLNLEISHRKVNGSFFCFDNPPIISGITYTLLFVMVVLLKPIWLVTKPLPLFFQFITFHFNF